MHFHSATVRFELRMDVIVERWFYFHSATVRFELLPKHLTPDRLLFPFRNGPI